MSLRHLNMTDGSAFYGWAIFQIFNTYLSERHERKGNILFRQNFDIDRALNSSSMFFFVRIFYGLVPVNTYDLSL